MRKNPNKNSTKNGSVRIIAGKYRGRKLSVLNAEGLRPTTDRIKETVFNWLMPYIQDAHCLDCFSGSGSLGFEALSRGATMVDFIELSTLAARQLRTNLLVLSADEDSKNAQVHHMDCLIFLANKGEPMDIVFVDPPFRQQLLQLVCDSLENNNWLKTEALIYIECEKELSDLNIPKNWQVLKEKNAGQVSYRLYQRTT